MICVYLVIRLSYGLTFVEISTDYIITYNFYEGINSPKSGMLVDLKQEKVFQIDDKGKTFFEKETTVFKERFKSEVFLSRKVKDILFLNGYKSEVYLETLKLPVQSNLLQAEAVIKVKKILGELPEVTDLNWTKEKIAIIPFIGSSYFDRGLFCFACYNMTHLDKDSNPSPIYEVIKMSTKDQFSDIATKYLVLIAQ